MCFKWVTLGLVRSPYKLYLNTAPAQKAFITILKLLSFRHLLERCFCLAFYFKWKYFVLVDHILSETICLLCFCVLLSNIYTKIWSDLCYFYSKVIFLAFLSKKILFTFLCWIWIIDVLQQYCEQFRRIVQVKLVENLAPSYLPYRFLHDLASFLLWKKVKIFDF